LDGLTNLAEFALAAQDPNRSHSTDPSNLYRGLEFTRNPDATAEITYDILGSQNLVIWTLIAARLASENWSSSGSISDSQSTVNTTPNNSLSRLVQSYFYRLRMTIP
jgi:hypothetical protein